MPYPAHTLVTIGGSLSEQQLAGEEIWQVGVRGFTDGGGPVPAEHLATLALNVLRGPTGAQGGMEGIWQDPLGHIPTNAKLAWCKAANIGPDGHYTAEPGIAQMTPLAGLVGPTIPSFCCIAISFSTGKTLGKAVRGRVYVPNYGAIVDIGSSVTAQTAGDIAQWGVKLLQAFDTSLASDPQAVFHPYVISKSGQSNVITGVRVGNVYDVQRRRKDAAPEVYQTRSFTP